MLTLPRPSSLLRLAHAFHRLLIGARRTTPWSGRVRLAALCCVALALSACGGGGKSASPPTEVTATAGDNQVTLTWNAESGVEYWVFYATDPTVSPENFVNVAGSKVIRGANTPQVVFPLVNGTTYYFTLNGRTDGGPGGSGTPVVSATPRPSGVVWTAGTPLGTFNLNAATFGAGAGFVTVGAGGQVFSSGNGKSWTAQTSGVTNDLNGVAYVNGAYVAVGNAGTTLRSADAITWTTATAGTQDLYAIAQQGAAAVAVGAGGTVITSANGTDWTAQTSGTTVALRGVALGNSLYVAVGDNGTILTSTDLVTWTRQSSGVAANLRSITFGLGLFVAVGDQGTILTSPDGVTWSLATNPTTDALDAVAVGSQFVAAGANGRILTSADGATWLPAASGTTATLLGLGSAGTGYVAVGAAGTNLSSF